MEVIKQFELWWRMAMGKSYYHLPQRMGKAFVPGALRGYYNDMTLKVNWAGQSDDQGVPICELRSGKLVTLPVTVLQKALGHYDLMLLNRSEADRKQFLHLCHWMVDRMDDRGGWEMWRPLGVEDCRSPYSAQVQGEALSCMTRAFQETGKEVFAEVAHQAYELMISPVDDGGTTYYEGAHVYLEEYPTFPRKTILNGWIYGLFGLYDYALAFDSTEAAERFNRSLASLVEALPAYDTGYWSKYENTYAIASPFYHSVHIHQLEALILIDNNPVLRETIALWRDYRTNPRNRARALLVKAWQKLTHPEPDTSVR